MPLTSARNMRTGSAWNAPPHTKEPDRRNAVVGMVTSRDHIASGHGVDSPGSASGFRI